MNNKNILKANWEKWEGLADFFNFGTLGLLFVAIFILESLPKDDAKVVVWYIAAFLLTTATIGFILGNIANKKMKLYFDAEKRHMDKLFSNVKKSLQEK